jgi:hypothetical protein
MIIDKKMKERFSQEDLDINQEKHNLEVNGFSHYQSKIICNPFQKLEFELEFEQLENDPYAPTGVNRYRRYGNGVILPWLDEKKIQWMPTIIKDKARYSGYNQGSNNPEHNDMRYFRALSGDIKSNEVLNQLVFDNFMCTFWPSSNQNLPIYFGVHFVKLQACNNGDLGISSPNCFHQDGEPFTFAHLFSRTKNAQGGVNYIGKTSSRNKPLDQVNDNDIIDSFTLKGLLETFAVHDPLVSHYVSPIFKDDDTDLPAERCMILIDFSQMKQVI